MIKQTAHYLQDWLRMIKRTQRQGDTNPLPQKQQQKNKKTNNNNKPLNICFGKFEECGGQLLKTTTTTTTTKKTVKRICK